MWVINGGNPTQPRFIYICGTDRCFNVMQTCTSSQRAALVSSYQTCVSHMKIGDFRNNNYNKTTFFHSGLLLNSNIPLLQEFGVRWRWIYHFSSQLLQFSLCRSQLCQQKDSKLQEETVSSLYWPIECIILFVLKAWPCIILLFYIYSGLLLLMHPFSLAISCNCRCASFLREIQTASSLTVLTVCLQVWSVVTVTTPSCDVRWCWVMVAQGGGKSTTCRWS